MTTEPDESTFGEEDSKDTADAVDRFVRDQSASSETNSPTDDGSGEQTFTAEDATDTAQTIDQQLRLKSKTQQEAATETADTVDDMLRLRSSLLSPKEASTAGETKMSKRKGPVESTNPDDDESFEAQYYKSQEAFETDEQRRELRFEQHNPSRKKEKNPPKKKKKNKRNPE